MPTLEEAYTECRAIARREAKNFYFSFVALPAHKRDAMCAVYAFMRRADDLSDDESLTVEQRRFDTERWLGEWRSARDGGTTADPVFIALNDTQRRFGISNDLLEKLVRGTTMDLSEEAPAGVLRTEIDGRSIDAYETFGDLYRYCYLVASVVGLVCIRIFGYTDGSAERLAEETGIAFQLTNILRDVKEDAERGRVYLPLEDAALGKGIELDEILRTAKGELPSAALKPLLKLEADRAEAYYASASRLLPLIDADSRAALWVLVTIYHSLLKLIVKREYDVFAERVSVPTWKKLAILGRGMAVSMWNRNTGKGTE